jgi:hypothetical protein
VAIFTFTGLLFYRPGLTRRRKGAEEDNKDYYIANSDGTNAFLSQMLTEVYKASKQQFSFL